MAIEECYMCEKAATSKEHVPPKCLFPELKDVPGQNHRKDLITVPSCDEHNSQKSKDDEFLLVSLAGFVGNNSVGYLQNKTKVRRAIERTSGHLLDVAFANQQHAIVKADSGREYPVIIAQPDEKRLERCFQHLAHGLYRHEFNDRFKGKNQIMLASLFHGSADLKRILAFVKKEAETALRGVGTNGKNDRVFTYQFTKPDQQGKRLLRMRFYEGVEVFVSFIPDGVETLDDILKVLLERVEKTGQKLTVEIGGEKYEFHPPV